MRTSARASLGATGLEVIEPNAMRPDIVRPGIVALLQNFSGLLGPVTLC